MGICGKHIAEPLYWYRRHPRGRLQWLKANKDLWDRAYVAMRELHRESYNGRYPMGCCGGKAPKGAARPRHGGVDRAIPETLTAPPGGRGLVKLMYAGPRMGDFRVAGGVTRTLYHIPGPGGIVEFDGTRTQGVWPADVAWFRSVNQGRDFRIVQEPAPPPPRPPAQPEPVPMATAANSEAWKPSVMEEASVRTEHEKPAAEAGPTAEAVTPAAIEGVAPGEGDTGSARSRRARRR